jgi:K+-transporting ATPase KdpF subunit
VPQTAADRSLTSRNEGVSFAGRTFCRRNHVLLRRRHSLYPRLRTPEIERTPGMLENIFLIVICVLLFGYLLVALLKPEKF